MKYILFSISVFVSFSLGLNAQIKIGDDADKINKNALLHLSSSSKGLLLPRIADKSVLNYGIDEKGMLIFDKKTNSLYIWDGKGWKLMGGSKFVIGSSIEEAVYTTAIEGNAKVGIGTTNPLHTLEIDADQKETTKDDRIIFSKDGRMTIGGDKPGEGALLNLNTTTKGLLLPHVPEINLQGHINKAGMVVYESRTKNVRFYDGTRWNNTLPKFVDGKNNKDHAIFIGPTPEKTRVGIGKKNPDETLDVNGDITVDKLIIEGSKGKQGMLAFSKDDFGTIEWRSVDKSPFRHNQTLKGAELVEKSDGKTKRTGTEVFVVKDDGGNVGVGLSDPLKKLDVNGSMKLSGQFQTEKIVLTDISSKITGKKVLVSDDDKGNARWRLTSELPLIADTTDKLIKVNKLSDGTTDRTPIGTPPVREFVIKDDGKVGIGTFNPNKQLDVKGDLNVERVLYVDHFQMETGKADGLYLMSNSNGEAYWGTPKLSPFWFDSGKSKIILIKNTEGKDRSLKEQIVFDDKGLTGIGTEDPEEALHIAGNMQILNTLKIGKGPREKGTIQVVDVRTPPRPTGVFIEKGEALTANTNREGRWKSLPFQHDLDNKRSHIPVLSDGSDREGGATFVLLEDGKLGLGKENPEFKIELSAGRGVGQEQDFHRIIGISNGPDVYPVLYYPKEAKEGGNILFGSDWGATSTNAGVNRGIMGIKNTAIGIAAMNTFTEGSENVAVGASSMKESKYGIGNVALGYKTLGAFIGDPNSIKKYPKDPYDIDPTPEGDNNTVIGALSAETDKEMTFTTIIGANVNNVGKINEEVIIANGDGERVIQVNIKGNSQIGQVPNNPSFTEGIALEVISKKGGFRPPLVTTSQRIAIASGGGDHLAGLQVYDSEVKALLMFNGKIWIEPGLSIGMRMWWSKSETTIPEGWQPVASAGGRYNIVAGQISSVKDAVKHKFDMNERGGVTVTTNTQKRLSVVNNSVKLTMEQIPGHIHPSKDASHNHDVDLYIRKTVKQPWDVGFYFLGIPVDGSGERAPTDEELDTSGIFNLDASESEHIHAVEKVGGAGPRKLTQAHIHTVDDSSPAYFTAGILIEYIGIK